MAIVVAPPRCGIERAGCVLNDDVVAWNAAMRPNESASEEESR